MSHPEEDPGMSLDEALSVLRGFDRDNIDDPATGIFADKLMKEAVPILIAAVERGIEYRKRADILIGMSQQRIDNLKGLGWIKSNEGVLMLQGEQNRHDFYVRIFDLDCKKVTT